MPLFYIKFSFLLKKNLISLRIFQERMYFCQTLLTKKNKRVMKELIEKVAELYAAFEKDA